MRGFLLRSVLTVATLGAASSVLAADLDYGVLRGPDDEPAYVPAVNWSGVYFGVHGGYSSAAMDFKNAYHDRLYNQLHDTTAETIFNISTLLRPEPMRVEGGSFGVFGGYNYQVDDLVLGIEVDYTHFGGTGRTGDSQSRVKTHDDIYEVVSATGESSMKLEDFGTIRARAGYALGSFLPFVTGGLAIGRAQLVDRISFRDYGFDKKGFESGAASYANFGYGPNGINYSNPYGSVGMEQSLGAVSKVKTVGGVSLGAGLEYMISPNILLRGEYQYVLFNDFDGHKMNLNTVRGGAALKF